MDGVKAKKHLGQHFLTDLSIARKIVDSLRGQYANVLEVGPGTGVLTRILLEHSQYNVHVVEIDRESIAYLQQHIPAIKENMHAADFLKMDLTSLFSTPFALIGNFPYNISSQILIKTFLKKR